MRSAFGTHGGTEVDTQGDAFFFAFRRASDAVGAAADGQAALDGGSVGSGLRILSAVAIGRAELRRVARLVGLVRQTLEGVDTPLEPTEQALEDHVLAALERLDPAVRASEEAAGAALTLDEALQPST